MAKRKSPGTRVAPRPCSLSVLLVASDALHRRRLAEAMHEAAFVVDGRLLKVAVEGLSQGGYGVLVAGLETVAEHVDRRRILDKLATIGVDYAQGNAPGRPYPLQGSSAGLASSAAD